MTVMPADPKFIVCAMPFSEDNLSLLGYFELLDLIAGYSQSALGRAAITAMRPSNELPVIRAHRGLYGDLLRLREESRSLPGLHFEDLGEVLHAVRPQDAMLDPTQLLACRAQLEVAAEVAAFSRTLDDAQYPELSRLAGRIDGCDLLRNALLRAIDSDGSILDSASEELRGIRRRRADAERRLQRELDAIIHSQELSDTLQDRFVTRRNGRYVVPVKRDCRSGLPGLVHDISSSGQTLFVEPGATLGLGNELSELAASERQEIRRILSRLSGMVRDNSGVLCANQDRLAQLDAAAAIARWSSDYNCTLPAFGGFLHLRAARHPLLAAQFRGKADKKLVPLDLRLPDGTRTLAITGSNTGGKTVVLKTTGLVVLAAQSGLPVPAGPESLFEIFDDVFADIGDTQSISENLSTFSGHLARIARILEGSAAGRTLILLDELGSGTDPQEGGALACAVLKDLSSRKALTMLTTHLGMVKNFVHGQAGMANASVRFNADTLQPEYLLDIGRPGASHALLVARRLGLPGRILAAAEHFMGGQERNLESMLSQMDAQQRQLASRNAAAEKARQEALRERDELQTELSALKRERKRLLNEAYARAQTMVDNTRRELENTIRDIKTAARRRGVQPDIDIPVAKARTVLAGRSSAIDAGLSQTADKSAGRPVDAAQLSVGQKIWVERLNAHGRIAAIDGQGRKIAVEVNGVRFTLKAGELFPARQTEDTAGEQPHVMVRTPHFEGQTRHELNVVGLHVDDALAQIETYLNECMLAGLEEVRLVHGFGTGRLREGIRQWLSRQTFVKSFRLGVDQRDPGGGGVTHVRLK